MYPILFKIGPITVYTYGVLIALGIAAAIIFALRQSKKDNIDSNTVIDLFLWIAVSGFIGARILYVITEFSYFVNNPSRIFFANEGFVFYGGFITACIAVIIFARKKNLKLWVIADFLAVPVALAHSVGRLGCFFYGCCYGKPTKSFIGVLFPSESPAGHLHIPVIPTQLIASLVLLGIFCCLLIIRKYKKFDGEIFLIYAVLYSVARFIIEYFRGDSRGHIWIFSTSQFIALFVVIAASLAIVRKRSDRSN